jgi:hypothetical protein
VFLSKPKSMGQTPSRCLLMDHGCRQAGSGLKLLLESEGVESVPGRDRDVLLALD